MLIILHPLRFLTEDTGIGRFSIEAISNEDRMVLLIDKIEDTAKICGAFGSQAPPSQWNGVSRNILKEIIQIDWSQMNLEGSIHLPLLPSTTNTVFLHSNALIGTVDLTQLPRCLRTLSLAKNRLTGTLDLTNLPSAMNSLYLEDNEFFGSVNFSKLPRNLRKLIMSSNKQLIGTVTSFNGILDVERTKIKDIRGQ